MEELSSEIAHFKDFCPNCHSLCETNMKLTDIPYFKSVLLMCTTCDTCGVKSSEVKPGSGFSEKGVRYSLTITDSVDLNRDLLKSEDATLEIPEIEFYMNSGTLGGKFTTVEGILKDAHEQLVESRPFSLDAEREAIMRDFLNKLKMIQEGHMIGLTLVIDDPSGNSYLQNLFAPDDDPNMTIEYYERTYEQNDLLGLNDIKTENYLE